MDNDTVIAVAIAAVILLAASSSKAAEPIRATRSDEPEPEPLDPIQGVPELFPEEPFLAGPICRHPIGGGQFFGNGEPYNAGQWPDPQTVLAGLRFLGFDAPGEDIESPAWKSEIRRAQSIFRARFLKGYSGAPQSMIDGVAGPCMLQSMTVAVRMKKRGDWAPV